MMKSHALLLAAFFVTLPAWAQNQPVLTPDEKAISTELSQLRKLPDAEWKISVGAIVHKIQQLPASPGKERLVGSLGNLATEGDAGHETLQALASLMAQVLRDSPNSGVSQTLAQLVRYEHVEAAPDNAKFRAAMAKLEEEDARRQHPQFMLHDLKGAEWSLEKLRGKVVLVNFWATWCPPCRKEMPDMQALYERFASRGLVILAISDEEAAKVEPFIAAQKYTYPVLLDAGRKVNEQFSVNGIPKSFVYDREGTLVAQAIDRRTAGQFLAMLKAAGLQ